ncbi:MAG: chitobiase/beta-hexosaminidase C-terminal domain-containing protein [Bacteroidales bacterium]|nr:chitobiase/beta-hexosaminidase C-terminal domain-containing protein [Bacteroidales bacterium]
MRYNNVILTATRWCAGLLVMGLTTLGSAVAQSHVVVSGNVFGGGNAAAVSGSTSVLMQDHALVENSVYGGGALANTGTYASSNTTTVTIAGGTVGDGTEGKGNVFGGALGDASHAPDVNGTVTVHIGTEAQVTADEANNVVIKGSVFGCNNAYGTPRKAVTVHIWRTKHTAGTDEVADAGFALQNVFGGGNQAHYTPTATQTASVIVHTCDNTIANLYGGGNAANVGVNGGTTAHVSTEIHGGRLGWVFGGGNGAGEGNPGANIYGNATLTVHAGIIEHLFGGSNEKGTITGTKDMQLLGDGECAQRDITEVYGGNNMAPGTDASLTISCPTGPATPWTIASVYGGSRAADLTGDVVLNIEGGTFGDVYGGNNQSGVIGGTVELNLYGGTITNAFGGNNAGGAINGVITVNVDSSRACPLVVNNVYGGGNLASYDPTGDGIDAPLVNIINGTVSESVYGGGYGNGAVVTANPQVTVGDNTASHHARVLTNVFGGGALADVEGNPTVTIKNDNSKVYGSVFGAGEGVETTNADDQKVALVKGNTTVSMTAGTVKGNIYGGGKMASVGDYTYSANGKAVTGLATANIGRTQVTVSGGTVGVEEADYTKVGDAAAVTGGSATREYGHTVNHKGHVFGGGLGKAGTNYAAYAFVDSARVDISGTAFVVGSVFGGGENGHVLENSGVHMNGGTVGQKLIYTERAINDATGAPNHHIYLGNVYGGGRGIDAEDHHFTATEGRVYGNTYVDISAGQVRHAVYGGGSLASVGTYVLDTISATDIKHYYIQNTGEAHVKVYGSAFIGHNGKDLEDDATDARAVHFLGAGKKAADLINANYRYLGSNCGMVYGSGRGLSSADPESDVPAIEKAEAAFTSFTYVTVDGSAQVCGSVFGGGENGHVKYNTLVQIKGGTIGGIPMHNADFNTSTEGFYDGTGSGTTLTNYYEDTEDESGVGPTVYRGNVYGGGRGVDHFGANLASGFSSSAGRVYGNTHVVVSGGTVYHHVFGGGSIASVGTYADNESPDEAKDIFLYKTYKGPLKSSYTDSDTINHSSGLTQVDIEGGVIGTTGHNEGSVFGGGRGIAGEFTWQIVHLAFVDRTIVNIKPGASVMGSVFGGGANGHVLDSTYVHLTGGIVGHPLEEADTLTTIYGYAPRTVFRGNVYGGGRGVDPLGAHKLSKTAGRVYGNTHVLMEGGWVRHSVFGGGSMASVGDYDTMTAAGTHDGFALKVGDVSGLKAGKDPSECGRAWVEITGGTVGSMARGTIYSDGGSYTDEMKTGQGGEGRNNGRVFGSCRGTAGEGYDHLAYVNITRVIIGTEGSATGPKIMGCVFGSGENGHVLDSTLVQMHSGEIGRGKIYDWKRTYIGNLYGGGRGIDLDHNNTLSSTAGWVRNSTHVEMTGGHVWHNVYGGGSLASVGPLVAEPTYTSSYDTTASKGRTWVEIKGGRVGRDGLFGGNVFGSGRGRAGVNTDTVFHLCNSACTYVPDVANPTSESVTIGSTSYGVRTLKKISNPAEDSLYLAVIPSKLTPYPDSIYYVLTAKADNSVKTVSHDFSERTNIHNAKVIVNFASNDTIVGGKRQGICGSVYGSGDNGHVLNLTSVNIKRGPIGNRIIFANAAARTAYLSKYPEADRDDINNNIASNGMVLTAGSVYGSGRGLDLANVGNNMSPTAGRVFGHTMVNVTGGHVMRNVYGGGNMAGVGEGYRTGDVVTSCHPTAGITTVKVSGGTIGMPYADVSSLEGTQCGQWGGNVFGSSRGLSSNEGLVKNMAYVRETHVNINNGTVYGSVFGGGENGHVWQNTYVTINGGTIGYDNVVSMDEPIYPGNVYGGGRGIDFTEASHVSRTSGAVYGNTNVLVTGGTIYHNVFGGGSLASVGRYVFYDTGDKPDSVLHAASASEVSAAGITPGIDSWGKSTVTVRGGIIGTDASNNGRVFGAGRGIAGQDGSGNAFNYYTFVDQTEVNIETGATINGCVFGSGDNGHVSGNAVVNVSGGTIGYDNGGPINGNVFGSGRGADRGRKSAGDDPYWYSATAGRVRGNTQVNITGGTIKNNIYGGGFMASVLGNTEVNIGTESGGPADLAIWGDVFGGSALGSIGTAGKTTTVNVLSGTIGSTSSYYYAANTALKGNIFGGGNGDAGVSASSETVTLYTDGTDTRIYQKAADVLNTVQVNIGNSSQYGDASKGATVLGNVFGCNNIAGSPQGDVHVDVYSTAHEAGDGISTGNVYPATLKGRVADVNVLDSLDLNALSSAEATALKATARFALSEVYGGGNKADYVPASASNTTGVTVHECEENTIQYVYGGGRAADIGNSSIAASTAVYIEGGHIKQVFAGGDGHTTDGSGNYLAANIKGDAIVTIEGGLVEQVFGGSNTTGMVEGTARVNFEPVNSCDLLLDEAFGGGNRAPGGGTVVTIPCGFKGSKVVYGGANEALITGNVILNIEGGTLTRAFGGSKSAPINGNVTVNVYGGSIDELFGGNDESGNITGTIEVNVDWGLNSCPDDTSLHYVYGGGYKAPYEPTGSYGPVTSGKVTNFTPVVNIIQATVDTAVFGGGYGTGTATNVDAHVDANPKVVIGAYRVKDHAGNTIDEQPNNHVRIGTSKNELGRTLAGNVFGGGNAGPVNGSPTVVIQGSDTKVWHNVYGGGNAAMVKGNPDVEIGGNVKLSVPKATQTGSTVTLTSREGATIYYTTDGTTPTSGSSEYSASLTGLAAGTVVKAIAYKADFKGPEKTSGVVTYTVTE